ncbi:MAG: 50S ribosomal protein L7/L12 [Planctomycetota bacterium]|nr:50S ribosomal protein L7/L12 [Planctomycetota bacterium]
MSESATIEVSADLKEIGDKIAGLTLKQAKELSDYIKDEYGIEPAAGGGAIMMAPTEGGPAAVAEPTEFDVVMTGFGDKKLDVVKVVKSITGSTLMEAKKLVESAPATIKEKASKEDAEKIKGELEKAGASVELKA